LNGAANASESASANAHALPPANENVSGSGSAKAAANCLLQRRALAEEAIGGAPLRQGQETLLDKVLRRERKKKYGAMETAVRWYSTWDGLRYREPLL
jgi:hypothetical protein